MTTTTMTTMLVTDAELALSLTSSSSSASSASTVGGGGRFGTSYVGCRRVRPSSRAVLDALKLQKNKNKNNHAQHQQPPLFGQEPPVETTTTKDAADSSNNDDDEDLSTTRKMEATMKKKKKKKRPRHDDGTTSRAASDDEDVGGTNDDDDDDDKSESDDDDDDAEGYYRFPTADGSVALSSSASASSTRRLQEEVADLAGEREGVPPVALPYSMMRLAVPKLLLLSQQQPLQASANLVPPDIVALFDEELSRQWAHALKEVLKEAEQLRDQDERVRKLPYVLEPEPWTRRRPPTMMLTTATRDEDRSSFDDVEGDAPPPPPVARKENGDEGTGPPVSDPPTPWMGSRSWFACRYDATDPGDSADGGRPPQPHHEMSRRAVTDAAVVQCLHLQTHLHVGCGAKFGCDYLLYEGSRRCFHAFAGVRVVVPPQHQGSSMSGDDDDNNMDDMEDDSAPTFDEDSALPLPTPYDMAGYVRGLNTAGKLALLATAIREPSTSRAGGCRDSPPPTYRVAIVDLALKKVRATTFRGASGTVTPKMLPKRPAGAEEAAVTGVGGGLIS